MSRRESAPLNGADSRRNRSATLPDMPDSTQDQQRRFFLLGEANNSSIVPPQQIGHILRRAVPQTNPDDLRRSPTDDAQPMEVLVLRDEYAFVFAGKPPNDGIWCSSSAQLSDMKRLGEQIHQQIGELLRKGLVEEQP